MKMSDQLLLHSCGSCTFFLSSQWTICTKGYIADTMRVQLGYRKGTVGVQWGGTGWVPEGYSGGTGEKHKTTQHWYTFFIFIVT